MLNKVRAWAENENIGFAWHTGSVPQKRRRSEILAFRSDPACRLFLSTDSGGVGLNLQNASVVINCDLPWNPARLEQRIARAWRKNQRRAVTVVNLVAENTIEHGMLASLANKMELAQGVLDGTGDLDKIKLKSGGQNLLKRLEQIMTTARSASPAPPAPPTDPAVAFAAKVRERLGSHLIHCDEIWFPASDTPVLLTVLRDASPVPRAAVEEIFRETPWSGEPPTLQLLEISAWEALHNLASAGWISIHSRATRPLLPIHGEVLTPEELARIADLRATAAKKRRAAEALCAAGLPEEAAPMTASAEQAEAEARAIEEKRG